MNKYIYLSTCSTCKRIQKEANINTDNFEFQDLKQELITQEDLQILYSKTGSYEALLNKRSQKYKTLGLKDKALSEEQIKEFLLTEYTFIKRPIVFVDDEVFIGNNKKTVEALIAKLKNEK